MTLRISAVTVTTQATVSAPVAASAPDSADTVLSESTTATPPPAASLSRSPWLADARRRIGGAKDAVENMQSLSEPTATTMDTLNDSPNIADHASDLYSTWGAVVNRMAWVVDITGKIAEVHPYAKMAWSILSFIPREIQGQIERDRNITSLLQAILDAFDIVEVANTWEGNNNEVDPRQVKVLEAMVGHCCDCGDFVQSYARNTKFHERLFDHDVNGNKANKTIEEYCAALARLKRQLMDLMAATAAVTVGQVQDKVKEVSGQIGKISSQMEQLSNEIAVVAWTQR
ncbi:hypothetical protein BC834DRAFT_881233 [Gloeopeniophorella convolvens]|nr:hypothetical protein BC834DRAFT_881233 [Gloeopeniophorella convolvens]